MVKRKSGKLPPTKSQKKAARRAGQLRKCHVPKGIMRDAWDTKLTSTQNLSRIGLKASVNALPSAQPRSSLRDGNLDTYKSDAQVALSTEVPATLERPDVLAALVVEAARPEKVAKAVVRPGEDLALRRMIAAHGEDYEAMSRDIKLNYLQWTPAQLRRKCERRKRIMGAAKVES